MSADNPQAYVAEESTRLQGDLGCNELLIAKDRPKHLYHYTDANGLRGMLESRKIHASDLRFMNDSGELQYANDLINEVLQRELSGCSENVSHAFNNILMELVAGELNPNRFYAACFCEKGDLLSQWRAYGNAGGGYVIGFDPSVLLSQVNTNRKPGGFQTIDLQQVHYDRETQASLVRPVISGFIGIAKRCDAEFEGRWDVVGAIRTCAFQAAVFLMSEVSRMKHRLFEEEQEWRLVRKQYVSTLMFRVSRAGLLVPYVELEFGGSTEERQAVAEVRWGPTHNPALAKASLEEFIWSNGYKGVNVEGSSITFRG